MNDDLISRQAALDIFDDYNVAVENGQIEAYSRDRKRLCDLPPAQPEPNLDEWCTNCKEYDHENHCCHRFTKVIRQTRRELQDEFVMTAVDGTLWVTVDDVQKVGRVIVDEDKSKFCRKFYMDAQPEPCEDAVKSHSEKDILNMCIYLLDEMVGYFGEYMEWIGYEPTKEEKVCGYFGMTYFHIVQKLFLYHTTHSGGTSTFKKCHELGIDDPSDGVRFPLWKEEEGDAE